MEVVPPVLTGPSPPPGEESHPVLKDVLRHAQTAALLRHLREADLVEDLVEDPEDVQEVVEDLVEDQVEDLDRTMKLLMLNKFCTVKKTM